MKVQLQNTTVGELIAILFDETANLNWLKPAEKKHFVAYVLNNLVRRSLRKKDNRLQTRLREQVRPAFTLKEPAALWDHGNILQITQKGSAVRITTRIFMSMVVGMAMLFSLVSTANAQERARADLKNASGKTVGTAVLRQMKEGVSISLQITDLAPGLHAVHIHSVGKCEGPAFASAGGHFNPLNMKHGLKSADGPHAGDLPDLYVNKDGVGRYQVLVQNVTLDPGNKSIVDAGGKSIVIHATADDNVTDPAGNSGDRIACGVISKTAGKK